MAGVKVSIFHDTRRHKVSGQYPISLRVYFGGKPKLYQIKDQGLPVYLNAEEFKGAYEVVKPKAKYQELHDMLQMHISHAKSLIRDIEHFTFEAFDRALNRGASGKGNIIAHYEDYIDNLSEGDQVGTASNYSLSLRSLLLYELSRSGIAIESEKGQSGIEYLNILKTKVKTLPFSKLTPAYLNGYERWMLSNESSLSTVGIYLRPLRAIFNLAIENKEVSEDLYPFGKRKYVIPGGRKVKKTLDMISLGTLFNAPVQNDLQAMAKAFWFFSYSTNGLNVSDYARLKYKDISGETIVFVRHKTKNTSKADYKPIVAPITAFAQLVIQKYGNADRSANNYVFPILNQAKTEKERHSAIQLFTRFVNQHIKLLAASAGITEGISTNWGRHSFTTNAIQQGASMEFIQESLGHADMKTTLNYFGGFEIARKTDIANKLMDFSIPND